MVYSVYGLMGRVEEVDREPVLDALDLPSDYPSGELQITPVMVEMAYALKDRNGEVVALIFNEGKVER